MWFDFIFILEELFSILFNRKILYANLLYKILNELIVFHSCLHDVYNDSCVTCQGSIDCDHSISPLCDKHKLWLWDSFMKTLVWLTVFRNRASLTIGKEATVCWLSDMFHFQAWDVSPNFITMFLTRDLSEIVWIDVELLLSLCSLTLTIIHKCTHKTLSLL